MKTDSFFWTHLIPVSQSMQKKSGKMIVNDMLGSLQLFISDKVSPKPGYLFQSYIIYFWISSTKSKEIYIKVGMFSKILSNCLICLNWVVRMLIVLILEYGSSLPYTYLRYKNLFLRFLKVQDKGHANVVDGLSWWIKPCWEHNKDFWVVSNKHVTFILKTKSISAELFPQWICEELYRILILL